MDIERLFQQLSKPFIILDDLNARSLCQGEPISGRGKIIDNLFELNPVKVLCFETQTFFHWMKDAFICFEVFIRLSKLPTVFPWSIGRSNSDCRLLLPLSVSVPRLTLFYRGNWGKFFNSFRPESHGSFESDSAIRAKNKPWWNRELAMAKRDRNRAERKYRSTNLIQDQINYKRAHSKCDILWK